MVGQKMAAATHLQDVITSKRLRSWSATLEQIMLKYVELCVDLQLSRPAKEGLYQFKNVSQHTNPASLELVIKRFLTLAQARAVVPEKGDKDSVDVEDLEESETPESLLLSSVTGDESRDRVRASPALRFLWEAYRTVIEVLRNNSKLETVYQETAQQAFYFCQKYNRKLELRRLCELLRSHVQWYSKSHQPNNINLSNSDSFQLHLDTRFVQLNVTVELELWQEAFRTVEDLHGLVYHAKKFPKAASLAVYYEKLMQVFLMSDNGLYHAYAYKLFFFQQKQVKTFSPEERTEIASAVFLCALASPILTPVRLSLGSNNSYIEQEEQDARANRLASLLFLQKTPSRDSLIQELLAKDILQMVSPELVELYKLLEVDFQPLVLHKKLTPILAVIEANPSLARYAPALKQVALARVLLQVSQVYSSLKLTTLAELAPFATPLAIEKHVVDMSKRGDISVRVNHLTQSVVFGLLPATAATDRDGSSGVRDVRFESRAFFYAYSYCLDQKTEIRSQLLAVSRRLEEASRLISPLQEAAVAEQRASFFNNIAKQVKEAHTSALQRKNLIEKKKEAVERALQQKEAAENREKQRQMALEAEAERVRLAEESQRREQERIQREREEIELSQRMRMAEDMKRKSEVIGIKLSMDDLKDLSPEELVKKQFQIFETEKKEMKARLSSIGKRMDHLERAYRKEEIPLLEQDFERLKKEDADQYAQNKAATLKAAQEQFARDTEMKERMGHLLAEAQAFRARVMAARQAAVQQKYDVTLKEVEEELQRRKEARARKQREEEERKKAEEEARRRQREEEEIRRREEEERRAEEEALRAEEEERLREEEEEARAKLEAEAAEAAEYNRRLDERAAMQRQKEAEIERRLAGSSEPPRRQASLPPREERSESSGGWRSQGERPESSGGWRSQAERSADTWRSEGPRRYNDQPRDDQPRDDRRSAEPRYRDFRQENANTSGSSGWRSAGSRDAPRDPRDAPRDAPRDSRDAPRDTRSWRDNRDEQRDSRPAPRDGGSYGSSRSTSSGNSWRRD